MHAGVDTLACMPVLMNCSRQQQGEAGKASECGRGINSCCHLSWCVVVSDCSKPAPALERHESHASWSCARVGLV
jgi:hypothetical protein